MSAITDAVDNWVRNNIATIDARQSAYLAAHGKFAQLKLSHTAIPNGVVAPADNRASHPTDQEEDWDDVNIPSPVNFGLRIDTYGGPSGNGFILFCYVRDGGETKLRLVDRGPEGRTAPWQTLA